MAIKVQGTTVIDDSRNLQNSVNMTAAGNVYANTFIGDGSQLTNLPATGGTVTAVASGTLSDGTTVVVNSDGTVSAVDVNGGTTSLSSETQFNYGESYHLAAAYYESRGLLIIFYRDSNNSYYGSARFARVSGSSFTFGSELRFNSSTTSFIVAEYLENSNENSVMIAYRDGADNYPKISTVYLYGTEGSETLAYGSEQTIDSVSTDNFDIAIDQDYNTRGVAVWRYNNDLKARVFSTHTTSPSMQGSAVTVTSGDVGPCNIIYDSSAQKFIVYYRNTSTGQINAKTITHNRGSNSLTVGGSTSTFGGSDCNTPAAVYHTASQKNVVFFKDNAANKTNVTVGTVSGNTIGFTTPVSIYGNPNYLHPNNVAYDPHRELAIIAVSDGSDSNKGKFGGVTVSGNTATLVSSVELNNGDSLFFAGVAYSSNTSDTFAVYGEASGHGQVVTVNNKGPNLNSDNFLGFSDGAYANGATATIQIAGSVDDAQSGLTAGQTYYVQKNGSLSTTAATPSVLGGTAVSSTKLLVKS